MARLALESLLQKSMGHLDERLGSKASPALFYAFDLLRLDGYDIRDVECPDRRHLL